MDRNTIDVYEQRAAEWLEQRGPGDDTAARQLGADAAATGLTGPVLDLGCGPGWHSTALGAPVLAVDAARAMLDLVPEQAPDAWRVQADLARLPIRSGALRGTWASKSLVHLPRTEVPLALHDLHRTMAVGAPLELVVFAGDAEHEALGDDDFAGRSFSLWPPELLVDVVVGAGFTVDAWTAEAEGDHPRIVVRATRARTLADTVGPGMRLLVCGLNPSVYAADAGVGFARPGNRFWPAARAAGLVTRDRDPRAAAVDHGIGMTDLVKRASPRADELRTEEYTAGFARLDRLAGWLQPGAICFVGLAGWRAAIDRRATAGPQDHRIGGRPVYLMPSTSGANASAPLDTLGAHLRAALALADTSSRTAPARGSAPA